MSDPPTSPELLQRRDLLKKAAVAGGVLWTLPTIDSFLSVAAAASGTLTNVPLVKSLNGNNIPDPPLSTTCTQGGIGNSRRGTVVWTRSESLGTICATITLSTGTSAVGREVFILQSATSGCIGGTATRAGIWQGAPANPLGPQTFCMPLLSGATTFVVALQLSGGGGVDGWSSVPATLP